MLGLIQERPLLISDALTHAALYHGRTPVVSRRRNGSFYHSSWSELEYRVRRLANALRRAGIGHGDRVATLAWNNHRHVEAYFAITAIGAVCHPINPRLFPEQVAYITRHADDVGLLYDLEYAALAKTVAENCTLRVNVAMCGSDELATGGCADVEAYEDFIAAASDDAAVYAAFDERTAASLCYTSGTTGNPKGVLSTHRALMIHAMVGRTSDLFDLRPASTACAIVPLYHAHASWGLPFAAAMTGCALVLPGLQLDGPSIAETINAFRVTVANGVPTIWNDLVGHLSTAGGSIPSLGRIVVAGSAPAPALVHALENDHKVDVCHIWGMTETGPCGTSGASLWGSESGSNQLARKNKQGHGVFGVQMRISNDKHAHCPWGDEHIGALQVRGPYVVSGYFKQEGAGSVDADGWFNTGDVASIDNDGYLKIVDRDKDLVKSGGEWISSIDVENTAGSFPGVREAAVIAIPHERWGERPLLLVVTADNAKIETDALLDFLSDRLAKWWVPDRIVFVPSLPKTGTGKVMKAELRKQFADAIAVEA
ncbi:long-chain-fatty-acid--CoA ligase [Bradyrhizobium australafricanum]|uniref:long-chain-fatty-acid--CoA ligase n=1 Tax=Bradyrhizobium australafricanum TaxID=2821406 RepID=UPI001CE28E38|nr:long-chain-fatty-acid--CoA ligase [Bradyrhizobium australafricanum]MCA6098404.1 long-chain-fatty-acid--CoA ligase [Bradyrhizobium australafricanum]